jgi:hypothetical protein
VGEEVPYQVVPQVAQLLAERENAVAYENDVRVAAIDRQLASLGHQVKAPEAAKKAAVEKPEAPGPEGRSAVPAKRQTAAG